MFNVECCKLHDRGSLKFFRGTLLNGHPGGFVPVGSVLGMTVTNETSKKSIKIHHAYDARPLIKSYSCY